MKTEEEVQALIDDAKNNPPTKTEIRQEMAERILRLVKDSALFTPENVRKLYTHEYEPELRWRPKGMYPHACPLSTDEALRQVAAKR